MLSNNSHPMSLVSDRIAIRHCVSGRRDGVMSDKHRTSIPKPMLKGIDGPPLVVMPVTVDLVEPIEILAIFPVDVWETMGSILPEQYKDKFFALSEHYEIVDKWRIVLPQNLARRANLKKGDKTIFEGCRFYIRWWPEKVFQDELDNLGLYFNLNNFGSLPPGSAA